MVQDIVNVSGQENGQQLSYSTGGIPGSADHAAVHRAFQAADHESLIRAAVEASPNKIAVTPDGKKVYVSHGGDVKGISVINTSDYSFAFIANAGNEF